jgi:hypothetical protein
MVYHKLLRAAPRVERSAMGGTTNVSSRLRFGALSIWVGLGTPIIIIGAVLLLSWVFSWIEKPFTPNSPHADLFFWLSAGIRNFERLGYLIGFCLGVTAMFRRGDRRWLGFIGACLSVLLWYGVPIHLVSFFF